jgi:long-chain fatty acid transport protein
MRTTTRVLFAIAIAAAAGDASATNGMRMIGFGPVQDAMGGANAAAGLDAASVLTNPATMSRMGGRIDFGASYFQPTVEYRAAQTAGLPAGAVVGSTSVVHSDRGASPIPAFGLVIPMSDRLRFGLGAYGVGGMGVDFQQNLYGGPTYSSYSQMRFTPGVSYQVTPWLAAGATLNASYATMEFNAAGGFGQVAHTAASSFGGGATFGLLVNATETLRFGVAYETRSWFQDFEFNIPANPALGVAAGHDRISFDQPQSATVGLAYRPFSPLLVAADVQWIRWSETNGANQPAFTTNTFAIPWNMNWDDQLVFKVGAEYTLPRKVQLRAGYNYGKAPLDRSRAFENIAFPAVAEHHLTAGIGHEITHKASINAAFGWSPKTTLRGSNAGLPPQMGGDGQAIQSYEASMSQLTFDMGFAYKF